MRRSRPFHDRRRLAVDESLGLAQPLFDQRAAQPGFQRNRPERDHVMAPTARGGDRHRRIGVAPRRMQACHEIAWSEGRVDRQRAEKAKTVFARKAQSGEHARERPGVGDLVGQYGQAEGRKARSIAIGVERQRAALRSEPRNGVRRERPTGEAQQRVARLRNDFRS